MKKKLLAFTIFTVFAFSLTLFAKNITIKKTNKVKVKGAVTFNHTKHMKVAKEAKKNCKFCHHNKKGGTKKSCAAKGCHTNKKLGMKMHDTCIKACHKANKDKAPYKCNDKRCHK